MMSYALKDAFLLSKVSVIYSLSFIHGKDTFVRKNKEKRVFLWFFAHLFVSLQHEKKIKDMPEDKKAQIVSLIRDTIRASEPTAQIILYGSRARGDAREDSDWDVLAIIDKPRLTLQDRSNLQFPVWDKGLALGQEINVFSYTRRQWEQAPPSLFKFNVMKEGITL